MNGNISRTDRLNAELQKEIYEVIQRKLKNPYITEMFSITKVDSSKDLKHAKVFISVYSTDQAKKETTYSAIKDDAKRIRFELAKSMRLRTVPELSFVLDESMAYGDKMDKLFIKINEGKND
ncbi:MAG: 30S ribosome-binding factor RbfA [Clostridia bacterium]|nr:30S ribosome-binding factor RbfA [Clostridia bacterium]